MRIAKQFSFDSSFVNSLPADSEKENCCRQVYHACYSRVTPRVCRSPSLVAWSAETAAELGISFAEKQRQKWAEILCGNHLLAGMEPFAMCYGGHQFGHWAGQLGDGRVINLGEVTAPDGRRLTLQLKGAGKTPYSRGGDGLAVLRSSIREFLCSEAMHHLGIPTTRALSLVVTGERVMRDMFYDGNPKLEPGAIVCRVAPSFIRFGSFEIFAARHDTQTLKTLIDYTISNDFPHLGPPSVKIYHRWFDEICTTTVTLVIHWMRVGFVHGVLNTDNMSILGQTIDYGPYGWLEGFEPTWTPNTTDADGRRYCYWNQPKVVLWNLSRLAGALLPVVGGLEQLEQSLENAEKYFQREWNNMFAAKLGFAEYTGERDEQLFSRLTDLLQETETDMTIFFRRLAEVSDGDPLETVGDAWYKPDEISRSYYQRFSQWFADYQKRLAEESRSFAERRAAMNRVNPKYVLRNYLAQQVIDKAETGSFREIEQLLEVMRHPYDEQPHLEKFAAKRPEWARNRKGCSMLSCSS